MGVFDDELAGPPLKSFGLGQETSGRVARILGNAGIAR